MSSDKTTSFRWEIVNFVIQRVISFSNNIDLTSDIFALKTRPSVQFTLIVDSHVYAYHQNCAAIVLKQMNDNECVRVNAKLWLENEDGDKFGMSKVDDQVFSKIDDKFGTVALSENEKDMWNTIRNSNSSLFVCCELVDLNPFIISTAEFCQDIWSMFEQEEYDAIVKVDQKEFKVFKFPFMAHSPVFKQMFKSSFKEGFTSTIEVKDVSETTMLVLIKWLYTEQIDDWSIAEELFVIADKYDICVLKKTCVQHLISILDNINAFRLFVLAVMHNDNMLKEASLDFVSKSPATYWVKFTMSEEWIEFTSKHTALAIEVSKLIRQKFNV